MQRLLSLLQYSLLWSILVSGSMCLFQGEALAQGGAVTTAAPSTYPPVPGGLFYRGNNPTQPGSAGYYFSLPMLIFSLSLVTLMVWTLGWIADDARSLKVRPEFWNTLGLLVAAAAVLILYLGPTPLVAVLGFLIGYAGLLGGYAPERNRKVPENSKILTPYHLQTIAIRGLARLGIEVGGKKAVHAAMGPPITFIGKSNKGGAGEVDRSRQVESSRGYTSARELVYDAILRRATDIHLEPKDDEFAVRLRVDGVMFPAEPFDRPTGESVVNIFKVLGAMDITERRKPQDGSFRAETEGREIDFRVATQGTQFGEKMSLRILDGGSTVRRLADLGMRKQLIEQIVGIVQQPHGLFLSCGPTGAGKSTTLYAALQEINRYENNIITVEDPVEYKMDGVTQIEINQKAGQTFAASLRSILRQDPDVVMLGEIRDGETAKIACQAANTGHMVFSTVHANDTITALSRVIDLGVEPFLLSDSLSAILGQRLCRKLCDDCKESYKPSADQLEKIGLPAEKAGVFYRPPKDGTDACPTCSGMGYMGRIGVFELLVINDRIRDLLRESPNMTSVRAEARKQGMLYMREEGLRLVLKGTTSLEELLRVVK